SVCAFTQKVRHLCRMLSERGHTVYHYGVEGSDPLCIERVSVVDDDTFQRVHGAYDYKRDGFRLDRDNECYRMFVRNGITAIAERAQPGDFLLCPFGLDHQPVAAALPQLIAVESGIGYDHTFAPYRVFESYAWMHFHYGKESRGLTPAWYDCVIPNCIDVNEFMLCGCQRREYHIFLGRATQLKGRQIAIDVCRELGIPLYVAGQGERDVPAGVTHLGVLGPKERAWYLAHAAALWCPTYYIEPFGTVAVEAAASGTPVICTDVGAFPETVLHGVTGYRCRTFEHFVWAARNVDRLKPGDCRRWAENYGLARIGAMYEEYFGMLAALHDGSGKGWYARRPERTQLDWLHAPR
ncbi:MAG TPA: glycosyltransferase, partial [Ktedonobacterales bacterium]|nr:glycosyltransferase [Ktedonobacterales bacterium]